MKIYCNKTLVVDLDEHLTNCGIELKALETRELHELTEAIIDMDESNVTLYNRYTIEEIKNILVNKRTGAFNEILSLYCYYRSQYSNDKEWSSERFEEAKKQSLDLATLLAQMSLDQGPITFNF